jgi:myo-inositol-1(or 4)-monophosphatase
VDKSRHGPELRLACKAAQAAGRVLVDERPGVLTHGARATKSSRTDPLTSADITAQRTIAELLTAARPDDALLGEEHLHRDGTSGWRWIIDPLDGTVNYLYGRDDWSVSIAAEDESGTAVAVVHAPALGRTYYATRGGGSWLAGPQTESRRIEVRPCSSLGTALVGTGFSYTARGRAAQAATLSALLPRVADIRRSGSAALDLAAVASGALDAFYEDDLERWDWAGGALIAAEAGADVTELPGSDGRRGILAASPRITSSLAGLLRSSRAS